MKRQVRLEVAPTFTSQVFEVLKDRILSGVYKPGRRLNEVEISQAMGTSRSPVREALQRLAIEGLVNLVPRKGAVVSVFHPQEVGNLFEVRGSLEVLAVRLATERAEVAQIEDLHQLLVKTKAALKRNEYSFYPWDLDFHQKVFEMTFNSKLAEMGSEICAQLQLARSYFGSQSGRINEVISEHEAIFSAILDRETEKGEAVTRIHIRNSKANMLKILAAAEKGAD